MEALDRRQCGRMTFLHAGIDINLHAVKICMRLSSSDGLEICGLFDSMKWK